MLRRNRLPALLLLAMAGCSTVSRERPPDVTVIPEESEMVAAPETNIKPVPPTNPPPSNNITIAAPPPSTQTSEPGLNETWIPLERWSRSSGYGTPRRIASDPATAYYFGSGNGTMAVRVGSQLASWNGLELRLGFAPQLIDGHPFVHALDVRKNFLPLLENTSRLRTNRVLVIDAGHGGTDIGAASVFNGHFEKEYTLDWARRLQAILATNGWTVWLTRTTDTNLSLPGRVAVAEQHKADIFISLHFNSSSPDRQQSGLETYCLTPTGMPSHLTRGFGDDLSLAYPNNRFDPENLQYAVGLHRALLEVNGHADRGVRRARFLGVLQGQNRPAVLVEGGYLSNLREAREIADAAYRQKLAEALAQALQENSRLVGTNVLTQAPAAPALVDPGHKLN